MLHKSCVFNRPNQAILLKEKHNSCVAKIQLINQLREVFSKIDHSIVGANQIMNLLKILAFKFAYYR